MYLTSLLQNPKKKLVNFAYKLKEIIKLVYLIPHSVLIKNC